MCANTGFTVVRAAAVLIRFAFGKRLGSLACQSGSSRLQNPRLLGGQGLQESQVFCLLGSCPRRLQPPARSSLLGSYPAPCPPPASPLPAPCQVFCLLGSCPLRPQFALKILEFSAVLLNDFIGSYWILRFFSWILSRFLGDFIRFFDFEPFLDDIQCLLAVFTCRFLFGFHLFLFDFEPFFTDFHWFLLDFSRF